MIKIPVIENMYTILGAVGLAVIIVVILLLIRKRNVTKIHFLYLVILAVFGLFVGGHLLFFIVGLPDFIRDSVPRIHSFSDFFGEFSIAASGMVFYGGLCAHFCLCIFTAENLSCLSAGTLI